MGRMISEDALYAVGDAHKHQMPMRLLVELVSSYTGIPVVLIRSTRRTADVARAKQLFMWLACNTPQPRPPSMSEVARFLKLSDHTCVVYGKKKVASNLIEHQKAIDSIQKVYLNVISGRSPYAQERREIAGHCLHKPVISLAAFKNEGFRV